AANRVRTFRARRPTQGFCGRLSATNRECALELPAFRRFHAQSHVSASVRFARGVAAMSSISISWGFLRSALLLLCVSGAAVAADQASVRGTVVDPLGSRVADATVTLLRDAQVIKQVQSD